MKSFFAILALLIVFAFSGPVLAREMALDVNGCHRDGIYGKYDCQEGKNAVESFISVDDYPAEADHSSLLAQQAPIRRNKSNVCFTPDSVLYKRQKEYRMYQSVKQCLRDGGHLDRTVFIRQ